MGVTAGLSHRGGLVVLVALLPYHIQAPSIVILQALQRSFVPHDISSIQGNPKATIVSLTE